MTSTQHRPGSKRGRNRATDPGSTRQSAKRPFGNNGRDNARLRTRPRSRGLIAAAAVLVLLFGAATAYLVVSAGDKVSVLTVGTPVAKGQVVQREVLVSTAVAGAPGAIPVDDVAEVIGQTAEVDLVAGQVLTAAMLTSEPTPTDGQATVGLALPPATAPGAGLDPGDVVRVLSVATTTTDGTGAGPRDGTTLSASATVYQVTSDAATGGVLMTVVLPEEDAAAVAAASAANQVAVIEIPAGVAGGP